jgi:hypothetical protein
MSVKKKAQKKKIKRQLRLKGINGKIKPTPQDIRIAKELVKPGVKKGEALIAAGVSPASARSNSAEIIARPGVQAALVTAMAEAGVTTERIAQVVNEGLSATKIINVNLLVLGTEEKKDMPCKDGIIDATKAEEPLIEKAFVRVEDYATRHSYVRTASELLDLFPAKDNPGAPDMPPGEESRMIEQAEQAAGSRDISRYTVIRERQTA